MNNKTSERMRYTRQTVVSNTFFQMPRFLTSGEFAGNKINNNARILYTLLLDRHKLSVKNGWFDGNGEVYIYFKREEMEKQLGLSDRTVSKVMQELKDLCLVEEKKQGLNKPNKIYLLSPVINDGESPEPYLDPDSDYSPENPDKTDYEDNTVTEAKDLRAEASNNYASEPEENAISKSENNSPHDAQELRPNHSNPNNNEKKNNNMSDNELSKTTTATNANEKSDLAAEAEIITPKHSDISIPYSQIQAMYNELCEKYGLRSIRSIDGKRKAHTAARFREYGLSGFVDLFDKTAASAFLCGGGERGWKADYDWLVSASGMQKVLEGKYENNQCNTPLPQIWIEDSYQAPIYSNMKNNNKNERIDPFLERAVSAYAAAAAAQ